MAVLKAPVVRAKSASSPRTVFSVPMQPSWQRARACGESASKLKLSAIPVRRTPLRKGDRLIKFLSDRVVMLGFILGGLGTLLIVKGYLRRTFSYFEPGGDFLQARAERFNLLLLPSYGRFLACRSGL